MTPLKKITRSNFFIRLRSWEYWPFGIIQLPVMIYFLWLAARARSLFFFSSSNPGIAMGGMFGESKFDVVGKIPARLKPKTALVRFPSAVEAILDIMNDKGFDFPVIFKPDVGERGFMVRRINGVDEIRNYLETLRADFIIQDLVDLPLEFGVFYRRYPSRSSGEVISIIQKEMLAVTGDGRSTLRELIFQKDRAKLQWHKLKVSWKDDVDRVVAAGAQVQLVDIGNHSMGTKFTDGAHLITEELSAGFDAISQGIDGFYFGRFDLRCSSVDDLYAGNIQIVELNGCGAEPAHIYDPAFGLFRAVGVLLRHWRDIFVIARENRAKGVPYISMKEGFRYYRKFKAATR